jgi:hypothetical protein
MSNNTSKQQRKKQMRYNRDMSIKKQRDRFEFNTRHLACLSLGEVNDMYELLKTSHFSPLTTQEVCSYRMISPFQTSLPNYAFLYSGNLHIMGTEVRWKLKNLRLKWEQDLEKTQGGGF